MYRGRHVENKIQLPELDAKKLLGNVQHLWCSVYPERIHPNRFWGLGLHPCKIYRAATFSQLEITSGVSPDVHTVTLQACQTFSRDQRRHSYWGHSFNQWRPRERHTLLRFHLSHISDWTSTFLRRVKKKLPKAFPASHRVAAAVRLHHVVLTAATTTPNQCSLHYRLLSYSLKC